MTETALDLSERLETLLHHDPDHRAMQYEGRWETWRDLARRVERLDDLLSSHGLGEGSTVGVVTRNRPPIAAAIVALLATRRCVVPITSIQSDVGVANDVAALGVSALLAASEDWGRDGLVDSCAESGVLGVEVMGDPQHPIRTIERLVTASTGGKAPGVAVLMPTSGTTGPPKRITYLYEHLNGALGRIAKYSAATQRSLGGPPKIRDSVVILPLALAHVAGFWGLLQAMVEGRSISLLDRFEPHAWADLVEEHEAKLASLPPATLRMVLDADIEPSKLRSLISVSCGTSALDPAVGEEFTARFGVPVLTAYGATEFPGGLVGWTLQDYKDHWQDKRGAAGRSRPGIELRIVDQETGAVRPAGEEGLVSVHSPQATSPGEDGWVLTNDIGRLDADGFLWLTGRADDAINRGGFKVVPQVVEDVLRSHPAVVEAGVTGVRDDRLGHVPVGAVTVQGPVDEAELQHWVRDRLAKYQVPVEIRIVDELPRTTSLKVSKEGLRALFESSDR